MSRANLFVIWIACLAVGALSALWMLVAIVVASPRAWRLAKSYDQLGNTMAGGDEDELFSARCWRYRADPSYALLVGVIDRLAGNPNHCQEAFEAEELKIK